MNDVRAVILAGGKGTRLRPLTAVFPKPLVPLGNKPIIEILLTRLASSGIRKVTLCTGYLAELIKAVCGDGSKWDLEIDYVGEEEPLGTAGPLANIENSTDPLLVMNGDLLTTLNFRDMVEHHRSEEADFTVGVFPREVKIDFGVVELDEENRFQRYNEKPTFHYDVSMGVNVIGRAALERIEKGRYLDIPDLVVDVHQSGGRVSCFRQECRWLDIGRMDDYALAQEEFQRDERAFLAVD